jgi:hypothetical protein
MLINLFSAIDDSFNQLTEVIDKLSDEAYCKKLNTLSGSSIGQHTRHIIEMYECLVNEYESGVVCYDDRKRDVEIETQKEMAKNKIAQIRSAFKLENKEIKLRISYGINNATDIILPSNYFRELVYNLEHAVHHNALIKAGLTECIEVDIPENFGIASSTIKHRKQQCAQ